LGASGNGNIGIGKGRSANGAQSFVAHQQPVANSEPVADVLKRPPFALFGALPVADVESRGSWSRAASAAQTQESMPPLRRTTARVRVPLDVDVMSMAIGCQTSFAIIL
jgi:hypothetical protein